MKYVSVSPHCALVFIYSGIGPATGDPSGQPGQPEAAPPALLEAGSVTVLAAGADSGHHQTVDVQRRTEGETSVSLRDKLEPL